MPKKVIILQHIANEDAGTILDFLNKSKIPHESIKLFDKKYTLPNMDEVRALVVMGGPMNVYEEDKFPFLIEENSFIQEAVNEKIPYLGICLGSQLLAKALGAKVYKAKRPEVGWDTLSLKDAVKKDKLFLGLGLSALKVLQWHEDTFDLPRGATLLASSELVPNQAYGIQGLFYGFQFHVEVKRAMLADWFKNREDLKAILSEFDSYEKELAGITEKLYENFFSLSS